MPSKLEHEIIKLRGEVSDTNEVYTDTIASLKDLITTLTTFVNTLDTDLAVNKQRTSRALRKAAKGVSIANAAASKLAGTLTDCTLNNCDISNGIIINNVSGAYTKGKLGMHGNKLAIGTGTAWEVITSVIIE